MKLIPGKLYRYCNYTHNHMPCNTILLFLHEKDGIRQFPTQIGKWFTFLKGKEEIRVFITNKSIERGLKDNYFSEDIEGITSCY